MPKPKKEKPCLPQTKLEYSTFNAYWETDYSNGSSGKTRSLEIDPQIGCFIANNFAIGFEIPYNRNKEIDGDDSYTTSSLMVMPFARYYFDNTKVKLYLHSAIGPGWGNSQTDISMGTNYETKHKLTGYEAAGGLGVSLNNYVSLDFRLG